MELGIYDYKMVSEYFTKKTGKNCSFIQDLATMFLTLDGKVYKIKKIKNNAESKEKLVEAITKAFERDIALSEAED